jgi:hypothetical protein
MTKAKVWIKPAIDIIPIKLAEYYHAASTDAGNAQHRSG